MISLVEELIRMAQEHTRGKRNTTDLKNFDHEMFDGSLRGLVREGKATELELSAAAIDLLKFEEPYYKNVGLEVLSRIDPKNEINQNDVVSIVSIQDIKSQLGLHFIFVITKFKMTKIKPLLEVVYADPEIGLDLKSSIASSFYELDEEHGLKYVFEI